MFFWGGYEKLFQSHEGSTDNYTRNSESLVVPTLKEYEYANDPEMVGYISDLQQGGLDYICQAINGEMQIKDEKSLYMPLVRCGMSPTLAQTNLFRFFYTTDGERLYFIPQKPLYKYTPKEFVLALGESSWKTGFMKAAFKIPFPYYWIYKLIRK